MRYLMNQKLFALTDRFVIKNASDEEVGAVVAKAFSVGAKLTFTDVRGREVASIHEKILAWGPTYEIYRDGTLAAAARKFKRAFAAVVSASGEVPSRVVRLGSMTRA